MKKRCDVAIVDYGLGNLFSVQNACKKVGLEAVISSQKDVIHAASCVILPGVGAFADAMAALTSSGLDQVLGETVADGKTLFCLCLGMQLLMSESQEFGRHKGLNIIEGEVLPLRALTDAGVRIKVPHVGWNGIFDPDADKKGLPQKWQGTLIEDVQNHEPMYFVHSYCVVPRDKRVVLAETIYGDQQFCSVLQYGNIFGCQCHPEKSATAGLKIYEKLAQKIRKANA